jgi:hypothetical protein
MRWTTWCPCWTPDLPSRAPLAPKTRLQHRAPRPKVDDDASFSRSFLARRGDGASASLPSLQQQRRPPGHSSSTADEYQPPRPRVTAVDQSHHIAFAHNTNSPAPIPLHETAASLLASSHPTSQIPVQPPPPLLWSPRHRHQRRRSKKKVTRMRWHPC